MMRVSQVAGIANASGLTGSVAIRVGMVGLLLCLAHTAPILADGEEVENDCGDCTIYYTFKGKVLTRKMNCRAGLNNCWDIPGYSTTECKSGTHSTTQGGIAAKSTVFGTATITPCTGEPKVCGEESSECDITYFKPKTPQEVAGGDNATSSILDEFDIPLLVCDTSWDGEQIVYEVSNFTEVEQFVTWPGTPFEDALVVVGETLQHAVPSPNPPRGVFGTVTFEHADEGTLIAMEVTTYFVRGVPAPTVSTWGLMGMTLLVLTAGAIVIGRRTGRASGHPIHAGNDGV